MEGKAIVAGTLLRRIRLRNAKPGRLSVTDEFTRTFENHWNDFRARWCDSTDLGGARAYSHDTVKAVMFHRVARVDVAGEEADRVIDAAVWFFRGKQYDCLFTLSPLDRPADMAERLKQRGFELALLPVAMLCDRPAGPVSAEEVEVEVAGAERYDTWAEIMCTCFGNPLEAVEVGRTVLCVPEVRLYLASRGGRAGRDGAAVLAERHRLYRCRRNPARAPPLRRRFRGGGARRRRLAGPGQPLDHPRGRMREPRRESLPAPRFPPHALPAALRQGLGGPEMTQRRLSPGSPRK